MDRVVGIETEYGCLLSEDEPHVNSELWPAKVKNYLFRRADAGTIDLHYRDYEEPPGNGGFLLNGGRLYLDMGHIEYASPDRKSTRLNSSHGYISYAVFCLKKKKTKTTEALPSPRRAVVLPI